MTAALDKPVLQVVVRSPAQDLMAVQPWLTAWKARLTLLLSWAAKPMPVPLLLPNLRQPEVYILAAVGSARGLISCGTGSLSPH